MNINEIFQKRLPEDLVEYYLYLIDEEFSLDDLRLKCLAISTNVVQDYIWNFEGFTLTVRQNGSSAHLYGSTNFGDFIEDEWLCVFILYQISKQIPQLVCRICDNDGEFLLIEAAEHLARWLTPDTASNRIFIHRGMLHIIPKNHESFKEFPDVDFSKPIAIETAVQVVARLPWVTQAHSNILRCIDTRMQRFSTDLLQYVQRVNVFIPRAIVCILDMHPHLISHAMRSFCYRDPLELRVCRTFTRFKPTDRVWTQVSMNRCCYAQLMQDNFTADERSGYEVSKSIGMDFKGHDLGCKIAHGFEMLCSRFRERKDNKTNKEFDIVMFQRYLDSLSDIGYFRGEIEGSILYKKLTENAKIFFDQNVNCESFLDDENVMQTTAYKIHSISKTVDPQTDVKRLKIEKSLMDLPSESSDEWMYLNDEGINDLVKEMNTGFEKLHKKHSKNTPLEKGSENSSENPPIEEVENLTKLSSKMKEFVRKFSDFEGVEQSGESPGDIRFDFDGFSQALKGILDGNSQGESQSEADSDDDDEFLSSADEEDSEDKEIENYMKEMDDELSETKVGESFVKSGKDEPVDIDLNLVQNFLESHSSSMGIHGPTESLLQSIGVSLPNNTD